MIRILAIESSADETGAAVLLGATSSAKSRLRRASDFKLLSNVVYSQIAIHQKTGGIVPEVAARSHIEKIFPVIRQALAKAKTRLTDLDAIAVTAGPGLVTSLMVGVDTAKALGFALDIPVLPINHHEGHLLSALGKGKKSINKFPALGLVVSGGHTLLVLVSKIGRYKILGATLDDAAGECFDKAAKILDLPYPGGPQIAKLASSGDPHAIAFPRPMLDSKNYDFSFSGLKTAVLYFVRDQKLRLGTTMKADICASLEQAVVDVLVAKTVRAATEYKAKTILLGGGVSANRKLRKALLAAFPHSDLRLPDSILTTDNAGMIAVTAFYQYISGKKRKNKTFAADPNLTIKSWA